MSPLRFIASSIILMSESFGSCMNNIREVFFMKFAFDSAQTLQCLVHEWRTHYNICTVLWNIKIAKLKCRQYTCTIQITPDQYDYKLVNILHFLLLIFLPSLYHALTTGGCGFI